jgi:hypothetical protein
MSLFGHFINKTGDGILPSSFFIPAEKTVVDLVRKVYKEAAESQWIPPRISKKRACLFWRLSAPWLF